MGGKSSRARKLLYFCVAPLTLVYGCSVGKQSLTPTVIVQPPEPPPAEEAPRVIEVIVPREERDRQQAQEYLVHARHLLAKGDFDGSMRENQRVLGLTKDHSPSDLATFNLGLIYAHPKNPKKDNKRAIGFFNRVIKGFPESALVEQAKIWVGVLDGVEKLKQVDLEIEEKKRDRAR
jgi:hypothetical protein